MAYIKRAAEDTIARVSKMFPVLLVTGPRQVGKTTLLQRMAEAQQNEGIERKYVTLDDPDVRYLAKHDPALLKSVGAEFSAGYVRMKKYPLHFRLR